MNPILKKVVGTTLIVLGVIGLFLPLLQGVLLIAAGLAVLEIEVFRKWTDDVRLRFRLQKEKKKRK